MTPTLHSAAIALADAVSESDLVLTDHPALRDAVIALRDAPSVEAGDALAVEVGRLDASVGGGVDIVRALRAWTVARGSLPAEVLTREVAHQQAVDLAIETGRAELAALRRCEPVIDPKRRTFGDEAKRKAWQDRVERLQAGIRAMQEYAARRWIQ